MGKKDERNYKIVHIVACRDCGFYKEKKNRDDAIREMDNHMSKKKGHYVDYWAEKR